MSQGGPRGMRTEELVTSSSRDKQLPSSLPTPCSCPSQARPAAAADQDQEEGREGVTSASPGWASRWKG